MYRRLGYGHSDIAAQEVRLAWARMRRCCACFIPLLKRSERLPRSSLSPGIKSGSVSVPSEFSRLRISAASYTYATSRQRVQTVLSRFMPASLLT